MAYSILLFSLASTLVPLALSKPVTPSKHPQLDSLTVRLGGQCRGALLVTIGSWL